MIREWRKKAHDLFLEKRGALALQELHPERAQLCDLKELSIASEYAHSIVFVNGYFSPQLSMIPNDVICLPLDEAFRSYGLFLQNRWARSLATENDSFALFNAAEHGKGAFVYVPPSIKASLHIVHIFTTTTCSSPRLEITLGKNAELALIQTIVSQESSFCCNGVMDLSLDMGSMVRFLTIQSLSSEAKLFSSLRATLKRDSKLETLTLTEGSAALRNRFFVELAEENSQCSIKGLAMLTDKRSLKIDAFVEHAAPHCTSSQHFKTLLAKDSKANFEGNIYVRPIAQKTVAYQLNNCLHLSETAKSSAKPNLEIFADDVKASHGATAVQLSSEELFYFRSRGLSVKEAKILLAQGFCNEMIDAVPRDTLRHFIFDILDRVLHDAI